MAHTHRTPNVPNPDVPRPWPIFGITIERYAELSAAVADARSDDEQAATVVKLGVTAEAWEAAKAGWTARMQDMRLMGQVATRWRMAAPPSR